MMRDFSKSHLRMFHILLQRTSKWVHLLFLLIILLIFNLVFGKFVTDIVILLSFVYFLNFWNSFGKLVFEFWTLYDLGDNYFVWTCWFFRAFLNCWIVWDCQVWTMLMIFEFWVYSLGIVGWNSISHRYWIIFAWIDVCGIFGWFLISHYYEILALKYRIVDCQIWAMLIFDLWLHFIGTMIFVTGNFLISFCDGKYFWLTRFFLKWSSLRNWTFFVDIMMIGKFCGWIYTYIYIYWYCFIWDIFIWCRISKVVVIFHWWRIVRSFYHLTLEQLSMLWVLRHFFKLFGNMILLSIKIFN